MDHNLNEEMDKGVELPEAEENLDAAPGAYSDKPVGKSFAEGLRPNAPKGKRLNPLVMRLAIFGCMLVMLGIVYGVYSRGAKQKQQHASKDSSDKTMLAATAMGNDVADKVAEMGRKSKKASASDTDGGKIPVDPLVDGQATVPALVAPNGSKTSTIPPVGVVALKDGVTRLPERSNGFGGGGAMPPAAPVSQTPVFHGKSAEEKQREELYNMEHQAMMASPAASKGSAGGSALEKVTGGSSNPLSSLLAGLGASGIGGFGAQQSLPQVAGGGKSEDDPNMQGQKEKFVQEAESRAPKPVLIGTRAKAISAYEIQNGWDIPAVLEQGINTDLPGQIKALVRENVYDTATGRYLLIPQGSRVVGTYDSHVAYGQSRVQVVWDELIFPDGTTMKLAGMLGQDATGAAGFGDKTNRHYARMFGMALVTSAFSAGIQLSQGNSTTTNGTQTNSSIATQALGQQLGQLGMEIARKNMNVQPTITVPIGYRFNIRVNRDVAFAEPYAPMGR